MIKCPKCHQFFSKRMLFTKNASKSLTNLFEEYLMDGKGVIRCPHCGVRLRKKISKWFIPALIPFLASAIHSYINYSLSPFVIPAFVLFMLFYIKLPYVPYDTE